MELFVERLDDGEVSTYLADVVEPGDELEVRGPIGGWFVWDGETPGAAGRRRLPASSRSSRCSGTRAPSAAPDLLRIAVSSRTMAELPYAEELLEAGALVVLTREAHGIRPAGRLTARRARAAVGAGPDGLRLRIGVLRGVGQPDRWSTSGFPAADIRVERFGPAEPRLDRSPAEVDPAEAPASSLGRIRGSVGHPRLPR